MKSTQHWSPSRNGCHCFSLRKVSGKFSPFGECGLTETVWWNIGMKSWDNSAATYSQCCCANVIANVCNTPGRRFWQLYTTWRIVSDFIKQSEFPEVATTKWTLLLQYAGWNYARLLNIVVTFGEHCNKSIQHWSPSRNGYNFVCRGIVAYGWWHISIELCYNRDSICFPDVIAPTLVLTFIERHGHVARAL